jgi:hypothetical protein
MTYLENLSSYNNLTGGDFYRCLEERGVKNVKMTAYNLMKTVTFAKTDDGSEILTKTKIEEMLTK